MYVAGEETTTETPGGGEVGSTPGGMCTGALFDLPVEPEECSCHPNNTNNSQVTSKILHENNNLEKNEIMLFNMLYVLLVIMR